MGGLTRRVGMMGKIDYGRNIILLDAGDFSGPAGHRLKKVTEIFFNVFGKLNYTGILPGEQELFLGISELKTLASEFKIPLICGNVFDKVTEDLTFEPYIIKEIKGRSIFSRKTKIGITGVLDDAFYNILPLTVRNKILIKSPEKVLDEIIPAMQDKCDIIILLVHSHYDITTKLSEKYPEIDIIVTGHGRLSPKKIKSFIPGKTFFLSDSKKGTHLSWLQIDLDKKKRISSIERNSIQLKFEFPEDPEILQMVNSITKNFNKVKSTNQQLQTFITSQKCRDCHLKEFDHWVKTRHARAYDTLVNAGKSDERNCLVCHVTGAGYHTGFGDLKTSPKLINVQCEACHGPGRLHSFKPEKGYGKVTRFSCTRCHNTKQDPDFNYKEDYKKVLHSK